jgi:hypothetical protein
MLPSQNDRTHHDLSRAHDHLMRSIAVHRFTHVALLPLAIPDEEPSWSASLELGNMRERGGQ